MVAQWLGDRDPFIYEWFPVQSPAGAPRDGPLVVQGREGIALCRDAAFCMLT